MDISGRQLGEIKLGYDHNVSSPIFSYDAQKIVAVFSGYKETTLNSDGEEIAIRSIPSIVRVWDLSGKQLSKFSGEVVGFNPDAQQIFTVSKDNIIQVWDLSGKQLAELKIKSDQFSKIYFNPNGKLIIIESPSGITNLWNLSGQQIAELEGYQSYITSMNFSPDGRLIVTASDDGSTRVWDLSGKQLVELKGHQDRVANASFSPNGQQVVTASDDGSTRVWDLSGNQLAEVSGNYATFSPDGQRIVSESNNTTRLWDLSGRQLAEFSGKTASSRPDGQQEIVIKTSSFSPDGRQIAIESNDGTVKVWRIGGLDELLTRGCQWLKSYLAQRPEKLEQLEVCQTQSMLVETAPALVSQGEKLAQTGDFDGAVAKFKKAKVWNPKLQINPETKAKPLVLIHQGETLVAKGEINKAIAAYIEAQKLDSTLKISADSLSELCWQGSLRGYAKDVMFACEKAVAKAPEDTSIKDSRDSRGLARALIGDTKGAIEDFQLFVNSTDDSEKKLQRQRWINTLRAGKNPFTPEELRQLSEE
ncbi:WD40 repeat domain-containing protein [Scytonema sp. PRP1]|uniref:WD40 repeat domain-containing protein n=1 Tax=Scytonema sp. PRP1 TaxID=3120513 RepID=UPI00300D6577